MSAPLMPSWLRGVRQYFSVSPAGAGKIYVRRSNKRKEASSSQYCCLKGATWTWQGPLSIARVGNFERQSSSLRRSAVWGRLASSSPKANSFCAPFDTAQSRLPNGATGQSTRRWPSGSSAGCREGSCHTRNTDCPGLRQGLSRWQRALFGPTSAASQSALGSEGHDCALSVDTLNSARRS